MLWYVLGKLVKYYILWHCRWQIKGHQGLLSKHYWGGGFWGGGKGHILPFIWGGHTYSANSQMGASRFCQSLDGGVQFCQCSEGVGGMTIICWRKSKSFHPPVMFSEWPLMVNTVQGKETCSFLAWYRRILGLSFDAQPQCSGGVIDEIVVGHAKKSILRPQR